MGSLRAIAVRFGLAACAAALVGCGGAPASRSADAHVTGADAAALRLTALITLDQRVARVGFRLSEANATLCPAVRQSAGWALHAAGQYSELLRPHARARFGLEGDLPGVLAAPSGSPAYAAGLREGDLLLAVNDQALERGPERAEPAYAGLAANIAVLDRALAEGPVRLTVRRDGVERSVTVQPRQACGYEVQLNPSDELNARADGRRLFISTALAGFAGSDDELAVILGHELAHHVLRHRTWDALGGEGRTDTAAGVTISSGTREQQADRVGLYLSARAGFDTTIAPAFWRRFGAFNWRVRYPQLRHDTAEARARALEAVHAEIVARRVAGEPLLP